MENNINTGAKSVEQMRAELDMINIQIEDGEMNIKKLKDRKNELEAQLAQLN